MTRIGGFHYVLILLFGIFNQCQNESNESISQKSNYTIDKQDLSQNGEGIRRAINETIQEDMFSEQNVSLNTTKSQRQRKFTTDDDNHDIQRELEEYAQLDTVSQMKVAQRSCESRGDCQDCVTPALLSALGTAIVIGLVIALVIDELFLQGEKEENIFMTPSQFEYKGTIDVEKKHEKFHLDVIEENDDADLNSPDKHFTFTTYRNEVYDIGSEIEKAALIPQSIASKK